MLAILILKIDFLKAFLRGFQKTNFRFSSACGAGKPKIGFIMNITV
jgi:hypothetical protein